MRSTLRVYIRYSDLVSNVAEPESELRARLADLPQRATFHFLAMACLIISIYDRSHGPKIQRALAANFLRPTLRFALKHLHGRDDAFGRPIFHRQQLLSAMRYVILYGRDDPEAEAAKDLDLSEEQRHLLGDVCLLANDLLVPQDAEDRLTLQDTTPEELARVSDEFFTQFLPVVELDTTLDGRRPIARATQLLNAWEALPQEVRFSNGQTLAELFRSKMGYDARDGLVLTFLIYAHYFIREPEAYFTQPELRNLRLSTQFKKLSIPTTDRSAFFARNAWSFEDLRSQVIDRSGVATQPRFDFTVFRARPFVFLNEDILTCIDAELLVERAFPGLYYTILDSLPSDKDAELFISKWGEVFEDYICGLLRRAYPDPKVLYTDTYFDGGGKNSGQELFDATLIEGTSLAGIECKASLLSISAKYSGVREDLVTQINRKFGRERHRGIEQLGRKIEALFSPESVQRRTFDSRDLTKIRSVIPVLVVQDRSLRFCFAARHLERLFTEELKARRTIGVKVRDLVLLTVDDIEDLSWHVRAGDVKLSEVLEAFRPRQDDPLRSFERTFRNLLRRKRVKIKDLEVVRELLEPFLAYLRSRFADLTENLRDSDKDNVEFEEAPIDKPLTHPWTKAEYDEKLKYYDFVEHPELIESVLEDYAPHAHWPAVAKFFELLRWLNGPDSPFESTDSAFRPFEHVSDPDFPEAHVACRGRLTIIWRPWWINGQPGRVEQLARSLVQELRQHYTPGEWGRIQLRAYTTQFLAETNVFNGKRLEIEFVAFGPAEEGAMAHLYRLFVALEKALQSIGQAEMAIRKIVT